MDHVSAAWRLPIAIVVLGIAAPAPAAAQQAIPCHHQWSATSFRWVGSAISDIVNACRKGHAESAAWDGVIREAQIVINGRDFARLPAFVQQDYRRLLQMAQQERDRVRAARSAGAANRPTQPSSTSPRTTSPTSALPVGKDWSLDNTISGQHSLSSGTVSGRVAPGTADGKIALTTADVVKKNGVMRFEDNAETAAFIRAAKQACDSGSQPDSGDPGCPLRWAADHKKDVPALYMSFRNGEHYLLTKYFCEARDKTMFFALRAPGVGVYGSLAATAYYAMRKTAYNGVGSARYVNSPATVEEARWAVQGVADCLMVRGDPVIARPTAPSARRCADRIKLESDIASFERQMGLVRKRAHPPADQIARMTAGERLEMENFQIQLNNLLEREKAAREQLDRLPPCDTTPASRR